MKYLVILLIIGAVAGGIFFYFRKTPSSQVQIDQSSTSSPIPSDVVSSSSALTTEVVSKEETMKSNKSFTAAPEMTIDPKKTYLATLTTNKGTIVIQLYASENPKTVNNFVFLSKNGFYDNTPFHRVIKGFMIQGGDPTGTGMGGPGYKFADEAVRREYTRGTIAMANSGPNTNGSQFFIMHADYPLPKNYVIFGSIDATDSESLKTLDALANTPVTMSASGEQSKPTETLTLQSVKITEK